jgi:hypothetical protein
MSAQILDERDKMDQMVPPKNHPASFNLLPKTKPENFPNLTLG